MACESRNLARKAPGRRPIAESSALASRLSELGEVAVPADVAFRRIWIEIQMGHEEPVNAIGLRIDPRDQMELKRWRDAGVDRYLRKG